MRRSRWYPLACTVEIASNSAGVHHAAELLWAEYPPQTAPPSARLSVGVSAAFSEIHDVPPMPRGQENIISIVDSRSNYAVADLNRGFATISLSANAARNTRFVLDTFLEPLTYLILGARHFVMAHAASMSLNKRAVLLCGDSGAGKTCLSYMCAKSGWDFLSGDATQIIRNSPAREIVGRPYSIRFRPSAAQIFPELAGLSISQRRTKADVDCETRSLGISSALRANLDHIVFLNRTRGTGSARLEEFDRANAFDWLNQSVFYGDQRVRAEQRETLNQTLRQPVWRLTYSDLSGAEQVLRELVRQS